MGSNLIVSRKRSRSHHSERLREMSPFSCGSACGVWARHGFSSNTGHISGNYIHCVWVIQQDGEITFWHNGAAENGSGVKVQERRRQPEAARSGQAAQRDDPSARWCRARTGRARPHFHYSSRVTLLTCKDPAKFTFDQSFGPRQVEVRRNWRSAALQQCRMFHTLSVELQAKMLNLLKRDGDPDQR